MNWRLKSRMSCLLTPNPCAVGGAAATGDRRVPGPVADAAELPSAGQVAEAAGEVSGEDHQAPPRLPPLLTTDPIKDFPIGILQKALKVISGVDKD